VTKYVFEDSCESRIIQLHERIEKGDITYTTELLSAAEALVVLRLPPPPTATPVSRTHVSPKGAGRCSDICNKTVAIACAVLIKHARHVARLTGTYLASVTTRQSKLLLVVS